MLMLIYYTFAFNRETLYLCIYIQIEEISPQLLFLIIKIFSKI